MRRISFLLAAALVSGATQASAQEPLIASQEEEHTWTADRPDGAAPGGVFADQTLDQGTLELSVSYSKMDLDGVKFETDYLTPDQTLDLFEIAPLTLATDLVELRLAAGLSDDVTLVARSGFVSKRREQITSERYFVLESEDLADTEVHVLWNAYDEGPVKAHVQAGILIPTGSVEESGDVAGIRSGILPYDMQTGVGTVAFMPGATIQMQNRVGTVGLQFLGRIYVSENDRGWRPGNAAEANAWAAYKVNDYFAVTGRIRAVGWAAIEQADDSLDPFRDPGELASSYGGVRVDAPVGLSIRMPTGPLAGHRLSLEWVSNVHESLDGPWLAADNGFVVTWRTAVGR
jgi:hypothetical protein